MSWNIQEVANQIAAQKMELAKRITKIQNENHPEQQVPLSETLLEERMKLIEMYQELLVDPIDVALQKIAVWGEETGEYCARLGMTIDVALDELPIYREVMATIISEEAKAQNASFDEYSEATGKLHRIIDKAAHSFSVAFVKHHNRLMMTAKEALNELSVPVVPLEEGVAVLPIIGMVDTDRAKLLMEEALKRSTKLNISYFILDLSGVPIIDTMVAHQLFQVIDSLRLLGIEAAITGIRPEIAQTVVSLGLDFSHVNTFATLQQALSAYRKAGHGEPSQKQYSLSQFKRGNEKSE
ncbi:STAS domain-containing protein [Peribacillus sp. SCS-155]|uniref:STAS domain-containing protein n=1 Tax=Peribacillus sedimenti TaxID=3115297 RepID=UPI00390686FB